MANRQIDQIPASDLSDSTSRSLIDSTDVQIERVSSPINTYGFKAGDLVWGKVKSHPWWPGHIFNELFASSSVRRTKSKGLLVAFYGDSSYGWFDPSELIPFEPNFLEKSKQTSQKTFIKAVEESIDELSRRAAMGLSCRCRNPLNFMSIRIENYYEVDVIGYQKNGIYSEEQILTERKRFDTKKVFGFLKSVAVWSTEINNNSKDVDWYRNVAALVAFRIARYEEFDETYAQAFGQVPVRPARKKMGVLEEMDSFGPRVAPLQGSLLIAENLGNKKKKAIQKPLPPASSTLPKEKKNKKEKFLVKKREQPPLPSSHSTPISSNDFLSQNREEADIKSEIKPEQIKPKKTKKRPFNENDQSSQQVKSAKKEKSKAAIEQTEITPPISSSNNQITIPPSIRLPSPPLNIDITQTNPRTLLANLTSLAASPFNELDPHSLSMIRFALARFRFLLYSKRPLLLENDIQEPDPVPEAPKPTAPLPDPLIGSPNPSHKRGPPDSLKPKPEKKIKASPISTNNKKKTDSAVRKPENGEPSGHPVKKPENGRPSGRPGKILDRGEPTSHPAKKQEKKEGPAQPVQERPTYLIMKFPHNATLPSVANLKARFVAFGPIIPDSTRVYWKTHTCKVLYKEKKDAVKAYVKCKDGGYFGNVSVNYSIHELEPPAAPVQKPPLEPMGRPVNLPRPVLTEPPKSILKKHGADEGKNQRVTFATSSKDNEIVNSPPKSPPPPVRNSKGLNDPRVMRAGSVRFSEEQGLPAVSGPAPVDRASESPQLVQVVPERVLNLQRDDEVKSQMYNLMVQIKTIVTGLSALPGVVPFSAM